ncbi:hypothetical protein AB0L99_22000 [Streptomyces sp. NPDC051954]|uniref:hypothetical protein n=1 Tax=unclassified Streptomyces TaxID=2593676 RepID=UPI003447961B
MSAYVAREVGGFARIEAGGTSGKAVTGTWAGTVSYMAPGACVVSDMTGMGQAFFTSTTIRPREDGKSSRCSLSGAAGLSSRHAVGPDVADGFRKHAGMTVRLSA